MIKCSINGTDNDEEEEAGGETLTSGQTGLLHIMLSMQTAGLVLARGCGGCFATS